MLLLLLFAFLAGIFTVLSPCILPILPVLLSAGTTGGKQRPLGIIIGLIVSFTFFTLALTQIVHATGISSNALRYVAVAIILLFGLVMLFPRLSDRFAAWTAPIATAGQNLQSKPSQGGFWSGILFGIALGLLWTPCAGPILAAITTLVATQAVDSSAVALTLAYSIGAALPMLALLYGSQLAFRSSRFLSTHAEGIRQFFGLVMIATALAIAFHWDTTLQQKIAHYLPPILLEDNEHVTKELEKLHPLVQNTVSVGEKAPEFTGITNWINSPPLSLMQLKGKVVLVDFWTYTCINCLRTLPHLEEWYQKYQDKGLVIIGVHTPEFEFEKDPINVMDATVRLQVFYPVAQDNNYKTWQAYHNRYWPAHYLIDQNGILRFVQFGEGNYIEMENAIRALLDLPALAQQEANPTQRLPMTRETYLGFGRGIGYTPEIQVEHNAVKDYTYSEVLPLDNVGLKGKWLVEEERITAKGNSSLDLHFQAKQVYLVLTGNSETTLKVFLDGKFVKEFVIDGDRKYDIVNTPYGKHQLSLQIPDGVSAYAFTFGNE